MRLLVGGSRGYPHMRPVLHILNLAWAEWNDRRDSSEFCIIAGGAKGPDWWAEAWAKEYARAGVTADIYRADWEKHGRRAGAIRNQQMLTEGKPTHAVLFWDGKSRGTRMMKDMLDSVPIPRRVITPDMLDPWTKGWDQ